MNEGRRRLRRLRIRLLLAAALGGAVAALAAGYAFASTRTAPIGTGVVVIDTRLGYQGGEAAGTGMVLTSSGEILTNNHVIRGATTIEVVVPGTSRSYSAKVVGYSVSGDVAVLKATGAANLKTISLGSSSSLKVGQAVHAVGNARGGGTLVTSSGTVTALARSITVSDESGATARLTGLVETNAGLEPGDSGGPLLSAAGKVVGMDTAASTSSGYRQIASTDGYAIPIDRAISIAKLIEAGKASGSVHVGGTAFLGVEAVATDAVPGYYDFPAGAVIAGVVSGGPAAAAGLERGDVVTAIAGRAVSSPADVGSLVLAKKPGTKVTITYVDTGGTRRTTQVTLGSGPPQ
jgi:S1-C subfamily serine protease